MKSIYLTTGMPPQRERVLRKRPKIKGIPFEQWGSDDKRRLDDALKPRPASAEPGAEHFSKWHLRNVVSSYGIALKWLEQEGRLDWSKAPAERWPDDVLVAYILWLEAEYPAATVKHRVSNLSVAMNKLDPSADLQRFKDAVHHRRRPKAQASREAADIGELIALSQKLRLKARELISKGDMAGARMLRLALQIGLFALTLVREGMISELTFDARGLLASQAGEQERIEKEDVWYHLYKLGSEWRIHLRAHETKNRKPYHEAVPKQLVDDLVLYFKTARTMLLGKKHCHTSSSQHVWVSQKSCKQAAGSISRDLNNATLAEYGKHCSPHMVRRGGATMMAQCAPDRLDDSSIMMDNSPTVRDRHYNLATTDDASLLWCELLESLLAAT